MTSAPPWFWRPLIDLVDGGMRRLLRARQSLVAHVALGKQQRELPLHDAAREAAMTARARRDAAHLGLDAQAAERLLTLSLQHCRSELAIPSSRFSEASMPHRPLLSSLSRLLPPPQRWAPLAHVVPPALLGEVMIRIFRRALAAPLADGTFAPICERSLAIEVNDLGLRWVVLVREGDVTMLSHDAPAEAAIRGSTTDLLLLASRLEDADTLFFQRRLQLTGDVELGLTARNLLDRMPWESVPLPLRIGLHRLARFSRSARDAHRAPRTN